MSVASIAQLSRLFRALGARDLDSAELVAAEIAGTEAEKGHRSASDQLRGCLNPNGRKMEFCSHDPRGAGPGSILGRALRRSAEPVQLRDVVLLPKWRAELEMIVREWEHRDELAKCGLKRRSTLLFHGPPGCGKSLTARALGDSLRLPTYVVRFDAVIGSYLGQTSGHLRELFGFAETTPCVLLLDEVDALGKKRGSPLDVGELDRIVIALMQELEHTTSAGLIVATSNLPCLLDSALWRRFDIVIEFPLPTKAALDQFVARTSKRLGAQFEGRSRRRIGHVKSFADALRIVEDEARRLVLKRCGGGT